nr:MAG TPA: hypothetical protein [Caudoviricetes sp.]
MNIVDIKKIQKLIGSEGGAAIVVDSLPTENIKPNVIYAVKKIDYYTSIYGTKMPTYTLENKDTWSKTAVEICSAKGLTKEEIQALGMAAGTFGFAVSDYLVYDNDIDYISKNIFDSGLFVWECASKQTGMTQDQFSIEHSFKTVVELYEYLLSDNFVKDVSDADSDGGDLSLFASAVVDILKSLNFKYHTTPLTADEIGVVAQETYSYTIWNGKEWVKLGEDVVIKEITEEQESHPDTITFTMEEFDKLWNGADLVLKSITLPLWQVCHVVQKIDLSTSSILQAKLILYRTAQDFTIDDYDNVNDISFGVGVGKNLTVPTVFGYERYYKPKTNKNVSIVWEEDDTYKSLGYNYKGSIQGYNGNTAIITFSPEDAASGNFSTFGTGGDSSTNYVYYVYAKALPDHTIIVNITVL